MPEQRCITGKDPKAPVSVPSFDTPFWRGELIQEVAEKLISHYPEFNWIDEKDYKIAYFWKAKGGRSKGKDVVGSAIKPAGLIGYLTQATYVIWIAADHVQTRGYTNFEFEALVYHELCHLDEDETESADGDLVYTPTLKNHDFEGFRSELDRYGFHKLDLSAASKHFATQLKLELESDRRVSGRPFNPYREPEDQDDDTSYASDRAVPDGITIEGKKATVTLTRGGVRREDDLPELRAAESEPTKAEMAAAFSAKGDGSLQVIYDPDRDEFRTVEGDIYATGAVEDSVGIGR